jgi:exodeoxyribonuclease-3
MKLVSWNVNGIRAVGRQHFLPWFEKEGADIVCVQEIKAQPEQLEENLLHPMGYHSVWHPAEKLGYSGVAIFSKKEPHEVRNGIGIPEIDREGRVLYADFGKFVVLNCYFPNSQRDHARLPYKLSFCRRFLKFSDSLRAKGKQLVICGDFNIAHKEIDLKNPKSNAKNAGFLPEERAWMDEFVKADYVDTFRHFDKGPDNYTWWSYRPGVRGKNIGWRLDYFFVNAEHADRLKSAKHRCEVMGSDHCPVVLELR